MRVRLKTTYAGPAGVFQAGTVCDFPPAEAMALVGGGYADAVDAPVVPEAAVMPEYEQAVMPAARGRPKSKRG